jgi:acetyltransferase-like isoleucine patch superfamily enzyme
MGTPLFLKNCSKISIMKKVRIFAGSRIELHGKEAELIIKENTSIGHNFHLICGGKMTIGNNTTIASNVFVNDIDSDYNQINKSTMDQTQIIRETSIGDYCFIGVGSTIQAGTKLGKNVIVGSNSFVKGNFPDYSIIGGVPAKIIKIYDNKTKTWKKI